MSKGGLVVAGVFGFILGALLSFTAVRNFDLQDNAASASVTEALNNKLITQIKNCRADIESNKTKLVRAQEEIRVANVDIEKLENFLRAERDRISFAEAQLNEQRKVAALERAAAKEKELRLIAEREAARSEALRQAAYTQSPPSTESIPCVLKSVKVEVPFLIGNNSARAVVQNKNSYAVTVYAEVRGSDGTLYTDSEALCGGCLQELYFGFGAGRGKAQKDTFRIFCY